MKQQHWVPPATRRELASPASPCGRHAQAVKIAVSLAGQGLHADAIVAQLRTLRATNVTDAGGGVRVCLNPVHPAATRLRNTHDGQLRGGGTAT